MRRLLSLLTFGFVAFAAMLLACTNHFRTPELGHPGNCSRYRELQAYWKSTQSLSWRDVAGAMHKVNLGQTTTQTMVFEPKSLTLRLAIGNRPASAGPFVSLDLATLFRGEVKSVAK